MASVGRRAAAALAVASSLVGLISAAAPFHIGAAWWLVAGGWTLAAVEASLLWDRRHSPAARQARNDLAEECRAEAEALFLFLGLDAQGQRPTRGSSADLRAILEALQTNPAVWQARYRTQHSEKVRSLARRLEPFGVLSAEARAVLSSDDQPYQVAELLRSLASELWS